MQHKTDRRASSAATMDSRTPEEWFDHIEKIEAENRRLRAGRDRAVELLMADPDRAAVATLDGLRKMLPELKVEEDKQISAILDWIGVAGDGELSLAERVRILALELATKQGYTLSEAERLCPPAEVPRGKPVPVESLLDEDDMTAAQDQEDTWQS